MDKETLLVLQAIKIRAPTASLLAQGFSAFKIAEQISKLIEGGLILNDPERGLALTEEGYRQTVLQANLKFVPRSALIAPLEKFRVKAIDKNAVYVPHPKDSSFFRSRMRGHQN